MITTQKWMNNVFIQIYSHSNFWKLGVPKNVIAMVCTDFAFALIRYNLKPYLLCEILLIPTFSKLFWIALFIENNFPFLLICYSYIEWFLCINCGIEQLIVLCIWYLYIIFIDSTNLDLWILIPTENLINHWPDFVSRAGRSPSTFPKHS